MKKSQRKQRESLHREDLEPNSNIWCFYGHVITKTPRANLVPNKDKLSIRLTTCKTVWHDSPKQHPREGNGSTLCSAAIYEWQPCCLKFIHVQRLS